MAQPETLGKHVHFYLEMKCRNKACGHVARWPKKMAVAVFGEGATVYTISQSIKCGVCGERSGYVGRA